MKTKPQTTISMKSSVCIESNRRLVTRLQTRSDRIRDKHNIYPESKEDKIVFVSNKYGNGFKKEDLSSFNYPSHIPISSMFEQINRAAENSWKQFHHNLQKKPLIQLENALHVGFLIVVLLILIYSILLRQQNHSFLTIMSYLMSFIIIYILVVSLIVCFWQKEKKKFLDQELIKAVQKKLMQFNQYEQQNSPQMPRFKWTCNSHCLWIAISF